MGLTKSFEVLLQSFAPVFTSPSFVTFRLLMTGWVLSTRHRYVTDLIVSSDSVGHGHFSDDHRFFSQAAWKIDNLWRLLAKLIIDRLLGEDAVIVLSGDDTLCRKRSLGIFGTGMHHDALSSSQIQKDMPLGTRLGRFVHRDRSSLVCTVESLFAADLHAAVSQSTGTDEGKKQDSETAHGHSEEGSIEGGQEDRRKERTSQSQREEESTGKQNTLQNTA
jgi:hypothetical protein